MNLIEQYIKAQRDLSLFAREFATQLAEDAELCSALATVHGFTAHAVKARLASDNIERITITPGSRWCHDEEEPSVYLTYGVRMSRKFRWSTLEIPFDALVNEKARAAWRAGYLARADQALRNQADSAHSALRSAKARIAKLPKHLRKIP